jgi:large subunit ribosomal protein L15
VASPIRSAWKRTSFVLDQLALLDGEVTPDPARAGLVKRQGPVKVLANGDLSSAVTVRGLKVSASAREKIVAAGGKVEE